VKWNLIIDIAKCSNCSNCLLACKDEHAGNDFPGYSAPQPKLGHRWIDIVKKERGQAPMVDVAYLPVMCQHCENAPCMNEATRGAVYRRPDGIVMIDPVKAKGRRDIAGACPYGAVWWNEELELPQKWFFDAHLLDRGAAEPRCVEVCPTGAMRAVKADDAHMAAIARDEQLQVLRPGLGTRPHVYYKSLDLFTKCFIGGSVAVVSGGIAECAAGAGVSLIKDGAVIARQVADNFGDFKFDGLEPDSGTYQVSIVHAAGERTVSVTPEDSVFLGEIVLP
jgi:Fe-S-cluster-containing dehydrogenase component